jgi:dGTPase
VRFVKKQQPSLEAQLANLADEIAYNNHDVDDGLRSGLLTLEQLEQVGIFARHCAQVRSLYPQLHDRRLIHETVRRMINTLVCDLADESRRRIGEHAPASIEEVRLGPPLIAFSASIQAEQQELKTFLRRNLYQHYRVQRMANKARRIVRELFDAFMGESRLLPPEFQARAEDNAPRAIADYIAGMTDRYAIREHRRIFAIEEA